MSGLSYAAPTSVDDAVKLLAAALGPTAIMILIFLFLP